MPDFIRRFGEQDSSGNFFLSPDRQSIITSLLSAGTFVGALGQAFTADRFGRRGSIFIWSVIFTIGTAIQTGTVNSLAQITIGRFIAGLGVGALSAIVPIFVSYIIDLGTHNVQSSSSWRVPVGLQMAWGLILCSGVLFLPESPRHLLGTGKRDVAKKVIAELNGVPVDDPLVEERVEELQFAINVENEGGKATWLECFSTRNALWKRTTNGMMLMFIQQLNGQNFYYYYGPTFFAAAKTGLDPLSIQAILGGVSVFGTIPALYLIEAWGRRASVLTGAVLEATCSIIAGLVGHFLLKSPNPDTNKTGGNVLVAFAVLHVLSFSIFWGPVPWVYLGESFPLRVRPKCIALGSATNWLWNFLLSFFAPKIAADIGPLILLIFFGMLVFGFVYVWFAIPETKGLSLEEVDEMYRAGIKPWHSVGWKPHLMEQAHEAATHHTHEKHPTEPEELSP
ncbi:hypothetical protein V5O48_011300 [Marasmius crinis-equi]|uniref:Major facilitator superfamily (MFS) profile domain-containing protein n=1 Tax=Marasmius crinis-equi TaxID=585013 RepID=A0ABR3F6E5_9AGAR